MVFSPLRPVFRMAACTEAESKCCDGSLVLDPHPAVSWKNPAAVLTV